MKMYLAVVFILALAGCGSGGGSPTSAVAPVTASVAPVASTAIPVPTAMWPTAIDFGDSVSLGYSGPARYDMDKGYVDYRHNAWSAENIVPEYNDWFFGTEAHAGENDGYAETLLLAMEQELNDQHYTVILFNAGLHNLQENMQTLIPDYTNTIEAIATLVEQHADIVIWIDTTPVPANIDPVASGMGNVAENAQLSYNVAARQVAVEHGFYMLSVTAYGQLPNNVHYDVSGYEALGERVSTCVLLAMAASHSDQCHK